MAVVIDELEVDLEEPQAQKRGGGWDGGDGGAAQQPPPKPEEIERAVRALSERAGRVWAH